MKKTILAIVLLLIVYIGGKIFFPELSGPETTKQTKWQTETDSQTQNTYIKFTEEEYCLGDTLHVCIVNPSKNEKELTFSWSVDGEPIDCTESFYTPSEEENESFLSVVATSKKGTTYGTSVYLSKLPVVYIDTDEEERIGDEYSSAKFSIQGNSTYTADNSELYSGDISIKLRGNSTRNLEKKPYKIKLQSKADLLGMGANKHWVLLANAIDHTFIRNKLVYDFAAELGAEFAAESDNVVLILNGTYQGVYQLCEQIRIAKQRINIFDWENLAEDAAKAIAKDIGESDSFADKLENALVNNLSWISEPHIYVYKNKSYDISKYVTIPSATGGFLLEMDFYHLNEKDSLQTKFSQPFYFNTPETGNSSKELSSYAADYIQSFEYALHSPDFIYHDADTHYKLVPGRFNQKNGWSYTTKKTDFSFPESDGKHYSELFDMDSLIHNFLICEFTVNWDSMKNSVFITKDIDQPASLSPNWDYDWAFGNINMYRIDTYLTDIWQTTNEYYTNEQCYQAVQWNRFLIKDPYFLWKVYEKYQEIRPVLLENMIKQGGLLETYHDQLKEAGIANDLRWRHTYLTYWGEEFEDAFTSLTNFIRERITWLDEQFVSFETFVNSLGYYKASELLSCEVSYDADGNATITAQVSDSSATSVSFAVNGASMYEEDLSQGTASVTIKASDLEKKGQNVVQIRMKNNDGYLSVPNKNNDDLTVVPSNYNIF